MRGDCGLTDATTGGEGSTLLDVDLFCRRRDPSDAAGDLGADDHAEGGSDGGEMNRECQGRLKNAKRHRANALEPKEREL